MKIRITAVLVAFGLTTCSIPIRNVLPALQDTLTTVAAEDKPMSGTCGDNLTWMLDTKGTLTISGNGEMEGYNNLKYYSPFHSRDDITDVIIEDGVTSIGTHAFNNCSNLSSIIIPNSVTSINSSAFSDCSSLTSITIPTSVTSIESYVFQGCSKLTNIIIPENLETIGDLAFEECSSLKTLVIPKSVVSIGHKVFCGCTSLTSIIIPEGVTSIGYETFSGCTRLTTITIPNSVTSISYSAFEDCSALMTVYYAGTEEQWKNISISSGNVYLKTAYYNSSDSSSELTAGFCGENLEWSLDEKGSLWIEGKGEMSNWSSTSPPWYSIRERIKAVKITSNSTKIGSNAFKDIPNLSIIMLSTNMKTISNQDFMGCTKLCGIMFGGGDGNKYYKSKAGVLYSRDESSIMICPIGYPDTYTIVDGTQTIANNAFWGCDRLTSVEIPDSITNIEENAFLKCTNLEDVYFAGTKKQWETIAIASGNNELTSARIHYKDSEPDSEPTENKIHHGDTDGDGVLDVKDVIALLKYVLGIGELKSPANADLNNDGSIDIFDLGLLKRLVLSQDS